MGVIGVIKSTISAIKAWVEMKMRDVIAELEDVKNTIYGFEEKIENYVRSNFYKKEPIKRFIELEYEYDSVYLHSYMLDDIRNSLKAGKKLVLYASSTNPRTDPEIVYCFDSTQIINQIYNDNEYYISYYDEYHNIYYTYYSRYDDECLEIRHHGYEIVIALTEETDSIYKFVAETTKEKVDTFNPTCNGNFSMNQTTGSSIGKYAFAEGYETQSGGRYAHAEGWGTSSSGDCAHAEGNHTGATFDNHAEGLYTIADGYYGFPQHAQGKYNVRSAGNTSKALAHIVGNGTSDNKRSNAHTLDYQGNAWYAGDVYVGSTSGVNRDEGSVKLISETDLMSALGVTDSEHYYETEAFENAVNSLIDSKLTPLETLADTILGGM